MGSAHGHAVRPDRRTALRQHRAYRVDPHAPAMGPARIPRTVLRQLRNLRNLEPARVAETRRAESAARTAGSRVDGRSGRGRMSAAHLPVLLDAVLAGLMPQPNET